MAHMVSDLMKAIRDALAADSDVTTMLTNGADSIYYMLDPADRDQLTVAKPFVHILPFTFPRIEGTTNSAHKHEVTLFVDFYFTEKKLVDKLEIFSDQAAKIEAVLKGTALQTMAFSGNRAELLEEGFEPEYIETDTEKLIRYTITYKYKQTK